MIIVKLDFGFLKVKFYLKTEVTRLILFINGKLPCFPRKMMQTDKVGMKVSINRQRYYVFELWFAGALTEVVPVEVNKWIQQREH